MPRNGSGTMSPSINFTTEAGSPPIEIAKLDTALTDISDALTNSIAADGQTPPTGNLIMNGFKHTNVAAATAMTQYARVQELVDQDHIYYVDSGAADAYVITPNPDISAYEEGQRFVIRIANTNTGASTLNVNGRGATAIQTADGSALIAGMLVAGGIYEFTFDANATPDRFVVTSPTSIVADGMLSANVALYDYANPSFSGDMEIDGSLDWGGGATIDSSDSVTTKDSGSFSATLSGMTGATTGTVDWVRVGDFIVLSVQAGGITGTSNTNALSLSGIPAEIRPAANRYTLMTSAIDNSNLLAAIGLVAAAGTIDFFICPASDPTLFGLTNFTTSGTKGLGGSAPIFYKL